MTASHKIRTNPASTFELSQREAARAEEKLLGHLRQSVPQNGRVHLLGIDRVTREGTPKETIGNLSCTPLGATSVKVLAQAGKLARPAALFTGSPRGSLAGTAVCPQDRPGRLSVCAPHVPARLLGAACRRCGPTARSWRFGAGQTGSYANGVGRI